LNDFLFNYKTELFMADLKIGLIGCGMIAERGHLIAINQTPGVVIHSLFDINFERAVELQKRFGAVHAFRTEEEFWSSDFDVAVICTPAPLHPQHVATAAKYGKDILCEKPLAMTEPEIEEMIRVTQQAGVKLYTGFTYRFSPSALKIQQLVREGSIGEVRSLRLIYIWNLHGKWTYDEAGKMIPSPLRVGRMREGGPMVDCGVHQIDLARWWLGSEVASFNGQGVWVEDFEAPDHMYLHLDHDCGAHTMVEMSFSYNATSKEPTSNFQYELIGTDGVIRWNREERNFTVRNSQGTLHLPWFPEKNFRGMYEELARAMASGEDGNMPRAEDGLAATRIARTATEDAIANRAETSRRHCSTMKRADERLLADVIPADSAEPGD
jgi:predicted dehydrogenase